MSDPIGAYTIPELLLYQIYLIGGEGREGSFLARLFAIRETSNYKVELVVYANVI